LLALAGIVFLAVRWEKHDVLLGLAALWGTMIVTSLQAGTYNRLHGAEVTETQFPGIHRDVQDLRRRFGAPPVRVFIVRQTTPEARSFGFRAPFVILLHSGLIDSLSPEELRCVIAQRLAAVVFDHTRVAILLGGDEATLPPVLAWIAWARDLIFAWYRRTEIWSVDRAAVLANSNVRTALRTQLKIAVGTRQFPLLREEALIEQIRKISQRKKYLQTLLIFLQSSTPPLLIRLGEMVRWAGLPPPDPSLQSAPSDPQN